MDPDTPVSVITGALGDFQESVMPIAGAALAVGAVVLAVTRGWRLAKRFIG